MSPQSFFHFRLIREKSVFFISFSHSHSLSGSSLERNLTSVSSAKTGPSESPEVTQFHENQLQNHNNDLSAALISTCTCC